MLEGSRIGAFGGNFSRRGLAGPPLVSTSTPARPLWGRSRALWASSSERRAFSTWEPLDRSLHNTSSVESATTEPDDGDGAALATRRESIPEQLLAKVPDQAMWERLLRVVSSRELVAISADLDEPAGLAVMVEHLGEANTGKLVRQWIREGSIAKANGVLARLQSGLGKELSETSPLREHSAVVDTNLAISLRNEADPVLAAQMKGPERARLEQVHSAAESKDLRLTNMSIGETHNPLGLRGVPISSTRESPEYLDVLRALEARGVGGKNGVADRAIVADVFFAVVERGVTPKLMTADGKVAKNLARIADIDPNLIGGMEGLVRQYGSAGFKVTIGSRSITVIPTH